MRAVLLATIALLGVNSPLSAQAVSPSRPADPASHRQVVSANPFGVLIGLFNAEYERKLTDSTSVGIGGSYFEDGDADDYVNGDLFVRFYPSGDALDGWSFGVKAGATHVGSGTYPGLGFDANWNWLLGRRDNFSVGAGFGLKRLFGAPEDYQRYVPTLRVINIGIAF